MDLQFMHRAVERALEAEREGNLPVGAVIVLDGEIIAEAGASILVPSFHPGRHAEMEALRAVPIDLWPRRRNMECYSTLEPCVMCMGALVVHGIGTVIYGAYDSLGGASSVLAHLPEYHARSTLPHWIGPVLPVECDPLYVRLKDRFAELDRATP